VLVGIVEKLKSFFSLYVGESCVLCFVNIGVVDPRQGSESNFRFSA
jgi:hypothetical protein